ncbi:MAG TPA: alpha/beta hydrolase [Terriglobales bacterium]|nr:alpha/beta hydrolase [Terriglobales bacterium]
MLFVVGVAAVLAYRVHRQHVNAEAMAIHTPNGINAGMYVRIGEIDQWIQIRGQDRNNPVLLCLHGGPGATWLPFTALFLPWEKEFTVVQWDQRGAGRTLEATGPAVADSMSIDRMAQDGIEVSEFLRSHLHKNKIILLGHSWGSILGIHMAKQRPDLFYAYVGTGQVGDLQESMRIGYAYILEKARAAGNKQAIKELENIGPPPYNSFDKVKVHFRWLGRYEAESDRVAESSLLSNMIFGAPNYSLRDIYNRNRGFFQIPTWRLYQEMLNTNLSSLGTDFKVPIYFFQGTEDEVTAAVPPRDYFEKINAPRKEFVAFEGVGHFAVWSMPNRFLPELVARVRPLALQP